MAAANASRSSIGPKRVEDSRRVDIHAVFRYNLLMMTPVQSDDSLIACCGLYCGACSFRVAFEENDRKHLIRMPAKYDKFKDAPMDRCDGCLAGECGHGFTGCAAAHGVEHCGRCGSFPCSRLRDFTRDGIPHHAGVIASLERIRRVGERQWLEEQAAAWRCSCGARLSWYHRTCDRCGRPAVDPEFNNQTDWR